MTKLFIIGIGYKPLDKRVRNIISNSGIILASKRLFEVFKGYEEFKAFKDKIKVINNVDETIKYIKSQISNLKSQIVLLASGDPMFFGIGRRIVNEFGKEIVEIIPDLSSVQVALSRIKEPWDNIYFISLHGGSGGVKRKLKYEISDIPKLVLKHEKIAILTDKEHNPSKIAKAFTLSPTAYSLSPVIYVCEKLGYSDEKITEGTPEEIARMKFEDPNLLIIKNIIPPIPPLTKGGKGGFSEVRFGLTEGEINHSKGLITKDEVRAVTIHKLRLPENGIFWDIGAGSGSISIEASRLSPDLKIYAVEKEIARIKNLKKNMREFNASNIETVKGRAPEALFSLPSPSRVFIGGSGENLTGIIKCVSERMPSGIAVINATTIETMNKAIEQLEKSGFNVEVTQVSIARSKPLKGKMHLSGLNPVFIISGRKE